jgi:hypothetical protein
MVVLVLCVGITLAEEFRAVITKVDGDKVTFAKTKFDKDTKKLEKGASETLPVADKVKVTKSKFDKDTKKAVTEDLDKGLKNEMFSKIDEKGISAQIVTDADNKKITEIRIGGGFGGFKKKDKQ